MPDQPSPGANGRWLVPGAFATLAEHLTGPPQHPPAPTGLSRDPDAAYRTGRVVGIGPTACYIEIADENRAVLPLLRPNAVQLPTGVRIGAAGGWPAHVGDPVAIGAAGIELGHWLITPARSWRPPQVRTAPGLDPQRALAVLTGAWPVSASWVDAVDPREVALGGWFGPTPSLAARAALHAAVLALAGDSPVPGATLTSLVGLGPGLTPSGDDAIAGCLLTLRLLGRLGRLRQIADELPAHLAATTSLSGSLLTAAADGYAAPQLVELLAAIGAFGPSTPHTRWRRLVEAVLAIGHSSGADLLTGVRATLAASAADTRVAALLTSHLAKETR